MRVKLGDRIYLCNVATLAGKLILLTTSNGVYTVNINSAFKAECCHDNLLFYGFYDFTGYEYSN